jgi:tetratricopeptide (TPR) repeat protein
VNASTPLGSPLTGPPGKTPSLNDLVGQWRKRPTPPAAVAACDALALQAETGGARQPQLARTVADETTRAFPTNLDVLLSVGRMLLAHSQLQMAKRHLLGAAKLAAEPRAPRLLGEVLLRQGDAKRAVRALQRAIQLGASDDETRGWYESANAYIPIQDEQGAEAVARAVDEGFRAQDDHGDVEEPESEDDDAPTMVAAAPQGAVLQLLERASKATGGKAARPERPAVPRDDEATGMSTLVPERDESPTRITRDEQPTRVTTTTPSGTSQPAGAARAPLAAVPAAAPPAVKPAPPPSLQLSAVQLHAEQSSPSFREENTAIMTDAELENLRNREQVEKRAPVLRSTTTKISKEEEDAADDVIAARQPVARAPEPPPPPPKPAAEADKPRGPKRSIVEEDSDDAWHLAVAKRGDAPPSSKVSKKSARRRSGLVAVGVAAAAILLTLGVGVRTGRLPEVASALPSWLSGQPDAPVAGADPAVAANAQPPAQPAAQPQQPAPQPAAAPPPAEPKTEPAVEPKAEPQPEEKVAENPKSDPAPQPASHQTYPVPRRPRPQPDPTPDPAPAQPAPTPKPKPGKGPDEPVWLGDPELK